MSFDIDPQILDDFLQESQELFLAIGNELISLEDNPKDIELLNSVFRNFHTIKGGASFLEIKPLEKTCHVIESIFDLIRDNKLVLTEEIFDLIFQVNSYIEKMFTSLSQKQNPNFPPKELLVKLEKISNLEQKQVKNSNNSSKEDKQDLDLEIEDLFAKNNKDIKTKNKKNLKVEKKSQTTKQTKNKVKKVVNKKNQNNETIKINKSILDNIMNFTGELVLLRNSLLALSQKQKTDKKLEKISSNLDLITSNLQNDVMKTRMQPVKNLFSKFLLLIRETAKGLDKKIKLNIKGEDTNLDRSLIDVLYEPLIHLLRNAADHGIEKPKERESLNKDLTGNIILSASQKQDKIVIAIEDDGKGMDAKILKELAFSKKIISKEEMELMSDKDAFELIFEPGFSSKKEVTNISGRGVGMDVVKNKLQEINAIINISSALNKGTKIEIELPLTLAILKALLFDVNNQTLAIPISLVNEIRQVDKKQIKLLKDKEFITVRNQTIAIYNLNKEIAQKDKDYPNLMQVIIIKIEDKLVGIVSEKLLGQEEVVVKPLDKILGKIKFLSGAAITSKGNISFILDILAFIKHKQEFIQK